MEEDLEERIRRFAAVYAALYAIRGAVLSAQPGEAAAQYESFPGLLSETERQSVEVYEDLKEALTRFHSHHVRRPIEPDGFLGSGVSFVRLLSQATVLALRPAYEGATVQLADALTAGSVTDGIKSAIDVLYKALRIDRFTDDVAEGLTAVSQVVGGIDQEVATRLANDVLNPFDVGLSVPISQYPWSQQFVDDHDDSVGTAGQQAVDELKEASHVREFSFKKLGIAVVSIILSLAAFVAVAVAYSASDPAFAHQSPASASQGLANDASRLNPPGVSRSATPSSTQIASPSVGGVQQQPQDSSNLTPGQKLLNKLGPVEFVRRVELQNPTVDQRAIDEIAEAVMKPADAVALSAETLLRLNSEGGRETRAVLTLTIGEALEQSTDDGQQQKDLLDTAAWVQEVNRGMTNVTIPAGPVALAKSHAVGGELVRQVGETSLAG